MVTRGKEIYKRVAKKHNIEHALVESIGNAMFQELRTKMETGSSLAYEMPKLGTFNIRFMKFLGMFERFDKNVKDGIEYYVTLAEENKERYERDKMIFELIKQFRLDKADAKAKRKAFQPGEDNPKEH